MTAKYANRYRLKFSIEILLQLNLALIICDVNIFWHRGAIYKYHMDWIGTTHRDWFTIRFNDPKDKIELRLRPYESDVLAFQDAADMTAKLIASRYKNIFVSYSGGLDSEFVCKVLLRNEIPFKALCFVSPFCVEEAEYARHFANKNDMEIDFLGSNKDKMISLCKVIHKKTSVNVFPCGYAHFVLDSAIKDPNTIVLTGDAHPFHHPTPAPFYHGPADFYVNLFCTVPRIHFFHYTKELYSACIREGLSTKLNTQSFKADLYQLDFRTKMWAEKFFDRTVWESYKKYTEILLDSREEKILTNVTDDMIESVI